MAEPEADIFTQKGQKSILRLLPLAVEAASIWLRPAVRGGRAGCSDTGADLWGTEGSNPSLSSGESSANLSFFD